MKDYPIGQKMVRKYYFSVHLLVMKISKFLSPKRFFRYCSYINQRKINLLTKFFNKNEDGAPSCSSDGIQIAFETHFGEDEKSSSEIWRTEIPNVL